VSSSNTTSVGAAVTVTAIRQVGHAG
jgi:hypothetical protein